MNDRSWFSAKLRLVCLIQDEGARRYQDSVMLFRASDFEEGFRRALELGLAAEETFQNADGREVRWRLKEILSLDAVADEDLDGVEVYSEPVSVEAGARIPFDASFQPERSRPTQSM